MRTASSIRSVPRASTLAVYSGDSNLPLRGFEPQDYIFHLAVLVLLSAVSCFRRLNLRSEVKVFDLCRVDLGIGDRYVLY